MDTVFGDDFSGGGDLNIGIESLGVGTHGGRGSLASGIDVAGDEIRFGDGEKGVLVLTDGGGLLEANVAAERILGMSREEMAAAGREGVFRDPGLRDAVEERRRKGSFRGRLRVVRGDETSFEAEVGKVDIGGGKVGVVFQEARASGEALVEGFFKALVENRAGVVILVGGDGVIRYASPSVEPILGDVPEKFIGTALEERLHPEDRGMASDVFGTLGERSSGNFRLLHGGGGWVEVEGSIENLLEEPEINGVALVGRKANPPRELPESGYEEKLRSMVERLGESERRLSESERLFRKTFDEAPVGIAHAGIDGRFIRVNERLCGILGRPRRELLGRLGSEITHTEDLDPSREAMRAMLDGERDSASVEKRYVRKDFTPVWVAVSATLVRDEEDGRPRYFICTFEDVTEAREARAIAKSLTGREMEVLKLLGRGKTNPEIAAAMSFSLSSAKADVGRVMKKLSASDRTNAAVEAAGLGIL